MTTVTPVIPHLWFDREAAEAARFYTSLFPDSAVDFVGKIRNTPSGDCDIVAFRLFGQPFRAIAAGPMFRFNPSISLSLHFDAMRDATARDRLDAAWEQLSSGGSVLMPLDAYPFSPRYGWVQDRFGLSWQLTLSAESPAPPPAIMPTLMFCGEVYGNAEEAGLFYRKVIGDSEAGLLLRYGEDMPPNRAGTVLVSSFRLGDTWIAAMDNAYPHGFSFNEAFSFMVLCRDQAEIDRHWRTLSAVPEAEACGWCKDRFGLSWQIVPAWLDTALRSGDQERVDRVIQALLPMKKIDVAALQAAFGAG
ncbi:VOC family protein [Cupriavidus sp. AU9028]|uniref:VOC family protein n=1 Tax=Cupriavidus sp. AU9028 TaxID=2871157 RepID=UPI001C95216A|nr:VOC family protein [Cupriavidus sp. AU9028]MBY4897241.1 VOC family protein [Cupriavidus sp. AU9028]